MSENDIKCESKRKPNPTKQIRNTKIRADVMAGAKVPEIAEQYGITKQQVYRVLSATETEEIISEYRSKMTASIGKAFARLITSIDNDFDGKGLTAALALLKSVGLVRDSVDVTHHGEVKHYATITLLDGRKIEMTSVLEKEEGK